MKCPNCDAEVPQGERFCPQCGVPITETAAGEPARCPHCGAVLLPGERFCGECGREVILTPPPPQFQTPLAPPVTPPPVTSVPPKRSSGTWIIIAAIALLVLGCLTLCVVFFIVPQFFPTPTPYVAATWTPSPTPKATFTPESPPTLMPSPTPGLELGELLYEQDFTVPDSDWEVGGSEDAVYTLEDGAYAIEVLKNDWMAWNAAGPNLDNFVLELDAGLMDGDEYNAYGVLFTYKDKSNRYELAINGYGSFTFGKKVDGEWTEIVGWTSHGAIQGLGTLNHITLIRLHGWVTLYINDEFVYEFYDDSLTEGSIAVVVTAYDTPPAKAVFDNIQIWEAK